MTFDSDLNPEGFSEKFSFDLHSPVMKNFTLMGMQLLFNEAPAAARTPMPSADRPPPNCNLANSGPPRRR